MPAWPSGVPESRSEGPRHRNRRLDSQRIEIQRLAQANLRRARIELAGHALDLDGIRLVDRLPPPRAAIFGERNYSFVKKCV